MDNNYNFEWIKFFLFDTYITSHSTFSTRWFRTQGQHSPLVVVFTRATSWTCVTGLVSLDLGLVPTQDHGTGAVPLDLGWMVGEGGSWLLTT